MDDSYNRYFIYENRENLTQVWNIQREEAEKMLKEILRFFLCCGPLDQQMKKNGIDLLVIDFIENYRELGRVWSAGLRSDETMKKMGRSSSVFGTTGWSRSIQSSNWRSKWSQAKNKISKKNHEKMFLLFFALQMSQLFIIFDFFLQNLKFVPHMFFGRLTKTDSIDIFFLFPWFFWKFPQLPGN